MRREAAATKHHYTYIPAIVHAPEEPRCLGVALVPRRVGAASGGARFRGAGPEARGPVRRRNLRGRSLRADSAERRTLVGFMVRRRRSRRMQNARCHTDAICRRRGAGQGKDEKWPRQQQRPSPPVPRKVPPVPRMVPPIVRTIPPPIPPHAHRRPKQPHPPRPPHPPRHWKPPWHREPPNRHRFTPPRTRSTNPPPSARETS